MVFEVINAQTPSRATKSPSGPSPALVEELVAGPQAVSPFAGTPGADPLADGGVDPAAGSSLPVQGPPRPMSHGVLSALLRSAVALQAEGLLRTAGALAGAWGGVIDHTEWVERDAKDLCALTAAAVAAGATLPAGLDAGAGDPDQPNSVVEGLLAGHEALARVLRQLVGVQPPGTDPEAWGPIVARLLERREQEMVLLRAVGAAGTLPLDEAYVHGVPPRA